MSIDLKVRGEAGIEMQIQCASLQCIVPSLKGPKCMMHCHPGFVDAKHWHFMMRQLQCSSFVQYSMHLHCNRVQPQCNVRMIINFCGMHCSLHENGHLVYLFVCICVFVYFMIRSKVFFIRLASRCICGFVFLHFIITSKVFTVR